MTEPMRRRLKEAWGITARVVSPAELGNASQAYDPERRLFMLSSLLRAENRTFALAYQLSLVEFAPVIERMVAAASPPDAGIRHLLHMSLANYAAGAVMMPYGRFLASANDHRYSIDRLCGEYGANVEQVAHRLTTLGRSGARGVPFFMLRVDPAGNISKRYAGENFPFSRFGGSCPRWNMHAAFQSAGRVVTQVIETPDGQRFFTVSRTIDRPIPTDMSGGCWRSGWGAISAMPIACRARTASTSAIRRSPLSAQLARFAPASTARTGQRLPQGDCSRSRRIARRSALIHSYRHKSAALALAVRPRNLRPKLDDWNIASAAATSRHHAGRGERHPALGD